MGVSARTPDPCLDESELLAYVDGRGVGSRHRSEVEAHVSWCAECRTLLSALAQSASVVQVKSGDAFATTELDPRQPSQPPPQVDVADAAALLSAPELAVRVGDIVAQKYRVQRVLGVGGMGLVVAAHHLALEQSFAIKFLHPRIARDAEAKTRFLREARAAAQLRGEHVVRVTDTGALESAAGPDLPFLVMELLDGQSLGTLLRAGRPFTADESVVYTLQAAEALAEAHRLGMVHRDLKPDNLFLARRADGTPFVKVVDFGISKTREDSGISITSHNAIMGTPRYMAPEQMRSSKDVDARADVWSLGAVLYELLAGVPPFDAASITELITKVQLLPHVPLATRCPNLAPALVAVVERCLQKEPSARIADMAEFARALRPVSPRDGWVHIERIGRLLGGAADASSGAPIVKAGRLPRIAVAAVVAASLLVGLFMLARHPATSGPAPAASSGRAAASASAPPDSTPSLPLVPGTAMLVDVPAPSAMSPNPKGSRPKPAAQVPPSSIAVLPSASPASPASSASATAPPADPHGLRSRN